MPCAIHEARWFLAGLVQVEPAARKTIATATGVEGLFESAAASKSSAAEFDPALSTWSAAWPALSS